MKKIFQELKKDLMTWYFWKVILMTTIGLALLSLVINGILIPHNFFSGGIAGIALLIYSFSEGTLAFGVIYLLINLSLFLLGFRSFAPRYILFSLFGMWIFSIEVSLLRFDFGLENPMLAAIFGGVVSGIGAGLYLRVGGSAGGLDIIATVFKKIFSIPIGTTFNIVNFFVLVANAWHYDLEIALYTGIYMFVFAVVVNKVQTGFSQRKSIFIITEKPDEVLEQAVRKLDRGATFFLAQGAYNQATKRVVYTVINMLELGRLKQYIFQVDSQAFIIINDASEVIGTKFLTWEEEGFHK